MVNLPCILAKKTVTVLTKNSEKLVRSLGLRKNRKKSGLFVAEGLKLVTDFLSAGFLPENIYSTMDLPDAFDTVRYEMISEAEMKRITFLETPSPVLAVFKIPESSLTHFVEAPMILVLDRVQDPGNVGTLLRTALWYGVEHVVCVVGTADIWSPKVVQASMSALAYVQTVVMHRDDLIEWTQTHKKSLVVADMNGTPAREFDWRDGQMLVMGNEGAGASEAFKALGERITLPGDASKMESLNVAVSGATLLYEYALSVKP